MTGMVTAAFCAALLASCTGEPPQGAASAPSDGKNGQVIVPGRPGESNRTMSADELRRSREKDTGKAELDHADIRFVRRMIPHHYQALVMTRMVPERAAGERVRGLAARIQDAQRAEIDAMRAWQERNDVEVTDARASYRSHLGNVEHLEMMGMATPAEMRRLEGAGGRGFDRLFLRLMKTHHEGAVTMAEHVLSNGRDVAVKQLAKDILVTQKDEINRMRKLLDS